MPGVPGEKPAVDSKPAMPDSEKIVKPASGVIEVVALMPGFHANERFKEGDKFTIQSMKQLGDWMKCVNPELEKQHQELIKAKKAKQKANAPKDDAAGE